MIVISMFLKASILISAVALIHAVWGGRMSAATRHMLWTFAVGGLLLLPALSFIVPSWTAFTASVPEARATTPAATPKPALVVSNPVTLTTPSSTRPPQQTTSVPFQPLNLPWFTLLTAIYATGVLFLLARLVFDRVSISRLVRQAGPMTDSDWQSLLVDCASNLNLQRPIRLLRSREETMPMALGVRNGKILIPAVADTWSEDRRRAVLLHEMAHLSRHDCLTQTLGAVACSLYWMHPGVWWIARRLRVERELACDDRVLSAGADARDYAGHLLELAYALRSGRRPALAVSMAGSGQLEGRLLALLDAARNRAVPALRSHLIGIVLLLVLLVPLAAATISVRRSSSIVPTQSSPGRSLVGRLAGIAQQAIRVPDPNAPGTWSIEATAQARVVHVQIREGNNSHGTTVNLDQISGLEGFPQGFPNVDGPVQFKLQRDAGTFTVEGVVHGGVGAGTYFFTPSRTFPDALVSRGFDRPSPGEQRLLATADIGFAFLDELSAQGFKPARLTDLLRAATHGVGLSYLRGMKQLGRRFDSVDTLIELAQHGVNPQFIQELEAEGLTGLSTDDLLRSRRSGVDAGYIRDLRAAGYGKLSLDALIQLRAHGVDAEYARNLGALGYAKLSLDELVQLRNHGVDPDYIRELAALGYQGLTLQQLVELRNHGVDPDYARELDELGYKKLSLDTLIGLRNHGVDPGYVQGIQSLGYSQLKIDDYVRMRNSGIGPSQVRSANARAQRQLSVDELVSLASRGWR
jgi:beta-lactamase regulating signal transducer with metallopeptidase domain